MKSSLKGPVIFCFIFLLSIFIYNGCQNDAITPRIDNVDVSYMVDRSTMDNGHGGDTLILGGDVLVITSAKILIRDIKLNVANGSDSTNFKVGPFVMNLDLTAGTATSVNLLTTAFIPEGNYDRIKFEIHKVGDNETPPDPEFVDANGRYSVIANGTFNGVPFTYKSKKSAHQFLVMPNSIVVTSSGKTNVTLSVKPYSWFVFNSVAILDPSNSNNENVIDNNIKDSFKAFRDNNKDGNPD
jgi:hypothetical protein